MRGKQLFYAEKKCRVGTFKRWVKRNTNKHLCGCGCDQYVTPSIERYYSKPKVWFINLHQNRGKHHLKYKGGIVVAKGYVWYAYPGDHPRKTLRGYVKRCWLVMEKKLGRFLKPDEVVHHVNHNKLDDPLENLTIVTRVEHGKIHCTGVANPAYRADVDAEIHVLPLALRGYTIPKMANQLHCSKPTIQRRLRHLRKSGLLSRKTAPAVVRWDNTHRPTLG